MKKIMNLVKLQLTNIYSVKKSLLMIVFLGLFIALTNKNMLSYIGGLYIMITCYTTAAYEEKSKMDYLIKSLPVNSKDFILSKFIFVIINTVIAIILTYIFSIFTLSNPDNLKVALITVLLMGVLTMTIIIPMALIFGFQKGKIFMIMLLMIPLSVSMEIMDLLPPNFLANLKIGVVGAILIVIISLVSFFVTTELYSKKEL